MEFLGGRIESYEGGSFQTFRPFFTFSTVFVFFVFSVFGGSPVFILWSYFLNLASCMAPRVRVQRTKYGAKLSYARLNYRALTAGVVAEVCGMLEAGSTLRVAADAIGLGFARVLRWVEDGGKVAETVAKTCDYPEGATPYDRLAFRLFVETERAKARRVQTVLKHLESGMIFDWRAAAWWLERQAPDFAAPSAKPSTLDSAPRADEEPAIHFYIPENGRAKV